jgi:hypothetical protein
MLTQHFVLCFRVLAGENGHHGRSGRHARGESLTMNLRILFQRCKLSLSILKSFFLLSNRVRDIYLKRRELAFYCSIFDSWTNKAFLIIHLHVCGTKGPIFRSPIFPRYTKNGIFAALVLFGSRMTKGIFTVVGLLHARQDPIPRFLIVCFVRVLILSPIGSAARMLSVPELILAATIGHKFVLDSPRSFFSYTEVARTARRSNL